MEPSRRAYSAILQRALKMFDRVAGSLCASAGFGLPADALDQHRTVASPGPAERFLDNAVERHAVGGVNRDSRDARLAGRSRDLCGVVALFVTGGSRKHNEDDWQLKLRC